jgi:hypothetical protein
MKLLVNVNSITNGNLKTIGDEDVFEFAVHNSGTLTIYTTGNTDTLGLLFNANLDQMDVDDNSGSNNNLNISRSVTAGVYWVRVRDLCKDRISQYLLHIEFASDTVDEPSNTRDTVTLKLMSPDRIKQTTRRK